MAKGRFSWTATVRSSSFLKPLGSMSVRPAAPTLGSLGSMMRFSEKMTSSAVTGLPLWNSRPGFSRMVHRSAAGLAEISSASTSSNR